MISRRELIDNELRTYRSEDITIVPGFTFNQKETIDRIYRYYNSKFEEGDVDRDGDKKYFFNINRNPCKVTTKGISFTPKDVRILTAAGGNSLHTWFLERDLKFWMKENNFAKVLSRLFDELPRFGSVVIKLVDGKPEFVDLRNFVVEASADLLDFSNYIIERHLYTPAEFRKIGEELNWENVQAALDAHYKTEQPFIAVYERYGDIEDEDEEGHIIRTYKRLLLADIGKDETDAAPENSSVKPGFVLEEVEEEKHPYWEFHLEKVPGRWLGVGIIEVLFDPQVNENETANLESKAGYWNALRIFQTPDSTVNKNLKSDVKDGEVLNPDTPVTQVEMPDRNLAYFATRTAKWRDNADDLTFRYEVVSGERLPAGTPLGSARIASAQAGAYFEEIRKIIAADLKEFIFGAIIPSFEEDSTPEHILRLVGDDLDELNSLLVSQVAVDELFRYMVENKSLPTQAHYDIIKAAVGQRVKLGKEKLVNIPTQFYQNVKYKLDIVITGQYRDTSVQAQTLFAAIQAITVDPTILTDPTKRKFFFQWLEAGGLNPTDFTPQSSQTIDDLVLEKGGGRLAEPATPGAGGGVSAPAPAQQQTVETSQTL